MMSNYSRTTQLVNSANNSAGASTEQFNKTLESLDAKLNRLHNAWTTFTTGIMDSGVIKGAVDLVYKLVDGINKLTEGSWAAKIAVVAFASVIGKVLIKVIESTLAKVL
jgi:hypothetical protein